MYIYVYKNTTLSGSLKIVLFVTENRSRNARPISICGSLGGLGSLPDKQIYGFVVSQSPTLQLSYLRQMPAEFDGKHS